MLEKLIEDFAAKEIIVPGFIAIETDKNQLKNILN